jgi:HD-like signal output (HDOD) protein/CheY-like chemotaxis protein
MRVLFVDDEPRVLEALERSLFQLDVEWDVSFASGGNQALAELEQAPCDVIVSDMRMPGMDGAALLTQVCEKYPQTVRIVLSGQTDEAAAIRVVRVAHQFLTKPCSADVLKQVIERTQALKGWLSDARLQAVVGQLDHLPPAPRLFGELTKALESESASADSVADIVRQDPAMSSKILQVVNSSFFSSSSSISDIRSAVVRLGLKTIRNLALGVGAFDSVSKLKQPSARTIEALQARSLAIAKLAGKIAQGTDDADAAFMAGLVCDIGELVLAVDAPQSADAPAVAGDFRAVTHAEVGAFLLGLWGLPFRIVEAVANHHSPERNAHERLGLPQTVWLASCLVRGEEPDPAYLERIGATKMLPKIRGLLA